MRALKVDDSRGEEVAPPAAMGSQAVSHFCALIECTTSCLLLLRCFWVVVCWRWMPKEVGEGGRRWEDILLPACAADDLDHGTNNATMLHHRDDCLLACLHGKRNDHNHRPRRAHCPQLHFMHAAVVERACRRREKMVMMVACVVSVCHSRQSASISGVVA